MTSAYTAMWEGLGLNLEAHEALLKALGEGYQAVFLAQKNRPERMDYFDFVISEIHGLRVQELIRAKEQGRLVVGTFCLFVPEELILAVDGIAVGLCAGADMGAELAERVLPRNTCALIKSFFGFKLGGVCPYVEACDFVIGETTCDGKKQAYEVFNDYKPTFVIEVPPIKSEPAKALWRSELARLTSKLEEASGKTITVEALKKATTTVNSKRKALHRLSALRAANPAPISGLDALLINQIQFYDDPVRFTEKVNLLCDELEERVKAGTGVAPSDAPRVLVSGCPMSIPNWKVPHVLETSGAVVVGEESCVGERGMRNLVSEEAGDRERLLDAIAERYLKIDCACFTPNLERMEHIVEMARSYRADGVVHYALQFCTPYTMEAGRVERMLTRERIPLLRLETDYSAEDVPQIRTRTQAFLEMLRS